MQLTPAQKLFVSKILKSDDDVVHVTRHEAGHRLMWSILYPDRKTRYAVVDGLPQVRMFDETQNKKRKIADMEKEDIAKLTAIKLAGYAAEMLLMSLDDDNSIAEIADFIATDYQADAPMIDWREDAQYGGDIPDACELIGRTVGWRNLAITLARFLKAAIVDLQDSGGELEKEQQEALKIIKGDML